MLARLVITGQACFTYRQTRSSSDAVRVTISAIGRGGAATRRLSHVDGIALLGYRTPAGLGLMVDREVKMGLFEPSEQLE